MFSPAKTFPTYFHFSFMKLHHNIGSRKLREEGVLLPCIATEKVQASGFSSQSVCCCCRARAKLWEIHVYIFHPLIALPRMLYSEREEMRCI